MSWTSTATDSLTHLCRKDTTIIADLVRNAAPTTDKRKGAAPFRRSLTLWANLTKLLPPRHGAALECSIHHGSPSLRPQFASALYHRLRTPRPPTPSSTHLHS